MSCSICYERFNTPVSLPCGHVFCAECIRRTIDCIKSASVQHFCPACRTAYNVVTIDPGLIPPYLRPHVLPPIRPVFLDAPAPSTSSSPAPAPEATATVLPLPLPPTTPETAAPKSSPPAPAPHVTAEVDAIRASCATWRRRAEVHAAANAGLLGFARTAKDAALRMRAERDTARNQCALLKRKLTEMAAENARYSGSSATAASTPEDAESDSSASSSELDLGLGLSGHRVGGAPARRGLPVFLQQQRMSNIRGSTPYDAQSRLGAPIKRRRMGPCDVPSAVVTMGQQTACH
ncbi:hypothetical protein C8R46DRAFT_1208986 [Mycena filopes]|nr:hypothetical protein C8R46DRAFT_1208986 [Mycena filopes]